jgi:hypothetical protein
MPELTIDALRANPWNVITHALPATPSRLLLLLACQAADYCRLSEFIIFRETGREADERGLIAHERFTEICALCGELYGTFLE